MPATPKDKKTPTKPDTKQNNTKNATPSGAKGIQKQQKQQKSKDLKEEAEKLFKYANNDNTTTTEEEETTSSDTKNMIQVHLYNLYAELRVPQIKQALSSFSISHIEKDAFNKAIVYFTNESDAQEFLKLRTVPIEKTKAIIFHHPLKQYKDSLLITNLGSDMTKKELEPYLNEIAKKYSCKLVSYDIIPTMSTNEESTTSSAFSATAYATFSKELADDVLEYNKTLIQGKKAGFRYVNESDLRVQYNQVHKTVTDEILIEYAQEAGKVEYVVQAKDDQGMNKPQFIVGYTSIASVRNAMDYDGADIYGKPVRISYLRGSEKKKK